MVIKISQHNTSKWRAAKLIYYLKLVSFLGFPRFCSSVCTQYNTRKQIEKWQKQGRPGNTYDLNDVRWTWSGHMKGSARLQVCTWESISYWSSRVEILCECLGSCLAMEHLIMKSSALFECGPLSPMSTSHPPDIIHVISVPRPSPFFTALLFSCTVIILIER